MEVTSTTLLNLDDALDLAEDLQQSPVAITSKVETAEYLQQSAVGTTSKAVTVDAMSCAAMVTPSKHQSAQIRKPRAIKVRTTRDDSDCNDIDQLLPRSGDTIKLINLIRKTWKLWEEVNYSICMQRLDFVNKNKPIFDEQKLHLIVIDSFAQKDIEKGITSSFKPRAPYFGPFLDTNTFSKEWNSQASEINSILKQVNQDIHSAAELKQLLSRSKSTKERTREKRNPLFYTLSVLGNGFRTCFITISIVWTVITVVFMVGSLGGHLRRREN